jgi:hypothetical protein
LAEECFEWAREASDQSVREQYASLGGFGLTAPRGQSVDPALTPSEPKTAQKVA